MNYITLQTGQRVSRVGQGCMGIGGDFNKDLSKLCSSIRALELGIEMGMNFLDTAEVYADGFSEEIIGKVAAGKRDKLFIGSKFSPTNHKYSDVVKSAENSLRRLNTDYIDLFQIHWPNPSVPIEETIRAMESLVNSGKVRYIGISNFSKREMLMVISALGQCKLFSNQVEYNLFDRFAEDSVLPFCQTNGVLLIAYSPLDKGRISSGDAKLKTLENIAEKYNKTTAQIALNWLTSHHCVVAIPKSLNLDHIRQNATSLDFELNPADNDLINKVFTSKPDLVDPGCIRVSLTGEGNRSVYQTRDEAISNSLNLSPSPLELASFIREGDPLKPVRIRPMETPSSNICFDLIEGRLRYWAWVIAFDGKKPIPCYIRQSASSK